MKTKYDTGQTIYVPLTIDAAKSFAGEVYYEPEETIEQIVSTLIPEYGVIEIDGRVFFDREVAAKYRKEKNAL